jgi:hypothetical protein
MPVQIMLQDVIDYLPLVGGPTPAEEGLLVALWEELWPLLKPLLVQLEGVLVVGWGFVLSAYVLAKECITKPEFIPSVMIISSATAMLSRKGKAVVKLDQRGAQWKGALPLSVLLCGVLLFAFIEWNKTRPDSKVSSQETAFIAARAS